MCVRRVNLVDVDVSSSVVPPRERPKGVEVLRATEERAWVWRVVVGACDIGWAKRLVKFESLTA